MNKRAFAVLMGLLLAMALAGAAAETAATPAPPSDFLVGPAVTPVPTVTQLPPATLVPPSQDLPNRTPAPVVLRDYVLGTSGDDVMAFKQRLQYLGYFRASTSLSSKISETTLERVNRLLADNGMDPVEVITTDMQSMIFSRDDLAVIATPTPPPTPAPLLAPRGTPALPMLDDAGFLADSGANAAFVFADEADGLWYYITDTLFINIRRYNDLENRNIWLETEVRTCGGERMLSFLSASPYSTYRTPVAIARENNAVLALTDDYFVRRKYGVIIRDGVVWRDTIRTKNKSYPIGDELAVFADGSMRAYAYDAYSAEEYLQLGAVQVLSFGPWLISGGAINPIVLQSTFMPYHEPRCALGMIAPGHYFILTVDGRYAGARGAMFSWLAERMRAVGVTEAINLDGGGTTALVFMGSQLSRVSSGRSDGANTRRVSSMIGFGVAGAEGE